VCWDGVDNDCDTIIDCADPDCAAHPSCAVCSPERCADGRDNDCDGRTDCDDPDCSDDPSCVARNDTCATALDVSSGGVFTGSTAGYVDDYQPVEGPPDCWGGRGPDAVFYLVIDERVQVDVSTFGSGFDTVLYSRMGHCTGGPQVECNDDSSGLQSQISGVFDPGIYFIFVDGYDRSSAGEYALHVSIGGTGAEICSDGIDNDGDGLIDCEDRDCSTDPSCGCIPEPEVGAAACSDGRDNDCDLLTDCDDQGDCAVLPEIGECCNGWDDNGNGFSDEFACRCSRARDCAPDQACYRDTVSACGPRCDALGGDIFCEYLFPGTTCNARSGQCSYGTVTP
jgi:hypothetical protein